MCYCETRCAHQMPNWQWQNGISFWTLSDSGLDSPSLLRRNNGANEVNRKPFNPKPKAAAKSRVDIGDHELATLGEASALFRVSYKTILRRVAAGELPGHKQGGQWRFPMAKLRELAGIAG